MALKLQQVRSKSECDGTTTMVVGSTVDFQRRRIFGIAAQHSDEDFSVQPFQHTDEDFSVLESSSRYGALMGSVSLSSTLRDKIAGCSFLFAHKLFDKMPIRKECKCSCIIDLFLPL